MTPFEVSETAKTQAVRLIDVAVIGPLMVWGGWKLRREAPAAASALAFFGLMTVVYNARNYLRVKEAQTRS